MNKSTKTFHDILRIIYLLITSAVMPLSILYLKMNYPEGIEWMGMTSLLAITTGGIFWSIFFIIFEQRYFPDEIKGALVSLITLVTNWTSATNLGSFNLLYGAYSVTAGSLLAHVLYFGVMIVHFIRPETRKTYFHYTNSSYAGLLLGGLISLSLLLFLFSNALINEFFSEPGLLWKGLYCAAFFFHVFNGLRRYQRHNMFRYDSDMMSQKRDRILERWALPVALSMITSIIISMGIAALV